MMAEEFTIAPMRRLLKKAGNLRVNEDAANTLRIFIGEYGSRIAKFAVENAIRDKRKTILERDIKKAAQMVWIPESRQAE
jgi:histone H3/H4